MNVQQSISVIDRIVSKLEFRLLTENARGSHFDTTDIRNTQSYKGLDVANTVIHEPTTPLYNIEFLRTPRMSTLAIGYVLQQLVQQMPVSSCYLNIGVWCGFTLFSGILGNSDKRCIGVDNFSDPTSRPIFEHQFAQFRSQQSQFFEMDFRKYLMSVHRDPIGVMLYDGPHSYQDQADALNLSHPFLQPGSYIVIDDANEPERSASARDFVSSHPGEYAIVLQRLTPNNGHPTFWNGIIVIQKCPSSRTWI